MELNQLRFFKTVAELENFSEASNILFVSQPALSKSIKNLEDELGLKLFDRIGKSIELNDAGKIILENAMHILADIDELYNDAAKIKQGKRITIYSQVYNFISYILPDLYLDSGYLNFEYGYQQEENLLNLLNHNKIDIAISSETIENSNIKCVKLCDDYAGIEFGKNNAKLIKLKFADINKLHNEEIVSYKNDTPTTLLVKVKNYLMIDKSIKFTNHANHDGLRRVVKKTGAITINSTMSRYYTQSDPERIFIPFAPNTHMRMTYYFCYRTDNENIQNILQILKSITDYLTEYNENMKNGCL